MIVLLEVAPDLQTTAGTRDPSTKKLAATSPAPALVEETAFQLGQECRPSRSDSRKRPLRFTADNHSRFRASLQFCRFTVSPTSQRLLTCFLAKLGQTALCASRQTRNSTPAPFVNPLGDDNRGISPNRQQQALVKKKRKEESLPHRYHWAGTFPLAHTNLRRSLAFLASRRQ
ncbi:PREDICTED: uncharacterized protein LOC104982139 isoform X2 [Bison bison bison]|uniref:Uncharacterized protein LOC104982139 isoform X2 n=1 Tax=Bison bison bison TaxID=43346 RepID=A0A6P3GDM4_BISBB|nr:PREDICTED: uncharacterized protein LOC104982139 isoform X2 [Bison bison bison]